MGNGEVWEIVRYGKQNVMSKHCKLLGRCVLSMLVPALASSNVLAQSLKAEIAIPARLLVKPAFVGAQELGFHIGYELAQNESWAELLQRRHPGYVFGVEQALKYYEQHDELPVNRDFQFCVLTDGFESLVVPEGMFVMTVSRHLRTRNGLSLIRHSSYKLLEQAFAPFEEGSRSIHVEFGRDRQVIPLLSSDAVSASRVVQVLRQSLSSHKHSSGEYLIVKRVTESGVRLAIVLPVSLGNTNFESYYDHFLGLPLAESDQLHWVDESSLQRFLERWNRSPVDIGLASSFRVTGEKSTSAEAGKPKLLEGRLKHSQNGPFCLDFDRRNEVTPKSR